VEIRVKASKGFMFEPDGRRVSLNSFPKPAISTRRNLSPAGEFLGSFFAHSKKEHCSSSGSRAAFKSCTAVAATKEFYHAKHILNDGIGASIYI
jgi:hypothetical protein